MGTLQRSYTDGFFNVSAQHGFLPAQLPLQQLPQRYSALQSLLDAMPVVLSNGQPGLLNESGSIAKAVEALPNYSDQVHEETDKQILQALYRGYCF